MKKIIKKIVCIIMVCVLLWGMFSTFEVMSKNLDPHPNYCSYNMYAILFENCRL